MANGLIGIIGGTGLGEALIEKLSDTEQQEIETPFGRPSDVILAGKFGGNKIAFINRHGQGHKLSPSE
ncbi:MAG: S-methyl-5'-thioadenosine phosphorylase, partial [Planctomycetota bacterium]